MTEAGLAEDYRRSIERANPTRRHRRVMAGLNEDVPTAQIATLDIIWKELTDGNNNR